ncbi:MAG: uL13 family ribosomal protein, partial [Desulfovibrio sp.]|nr:uL13 family ribosomal protein [Desulfovibrio sp.]
RSLGDLLADKPARVLMTAVRGMLPKNRLGRAILKKLKIYTGPDHPHVAQNPQILQLPC